MATQPTRPTRGTERALTPAPATVEQNRSILERCQARRAEHKQARLTSARNRRMLAKWLRRTANRTPHPRPLTRTPEPLLHYRVSAVRTDLLEIAATLEHTQRPDPARLTALRDLLANGCDSPLYNPDIHISELRATVHYLRVELRDTLPIGEV
jgi:hypothetical protein